MFHVEHSSRRGSGGYFRVRAAINSLDQAESDPTSRRRISTRARYPRARGESKEDASPISPACGESEEDASLMCTARGESEEDASPMCTACGESSPLGLSAALPLALGWRP